MYDISVVSFFGNAGNKAAKVEIWLFSDCRPYFSEIDSSLRDRLDVGDFGDSFEVLFSVFINEFDGIFVEFFHFVFHGDVFIVFIVFLVFLQK